MVKYFTLISLVVLGLFSCNESTVRNPELKAQDEAYCDSLRSWGAADASIGQDNILGYGVYKGQVPADPNYVAKEMFELAVSYGIQDLAGCQVVELPDYKILGIYRPKANN